MGDSRDRPAPSLKFELQQALPLMNEWQRWHWRMRGAFIRQVAQEVYVALYQAGVKYTDQPYPLQRCRIRVVRQSKYTSAAPDRDAVIVKPLLDAMQPMSKRHPYGLGIIADDSREVIDRLDVEIARGPARTTVEIWEVTDEGSNVQEG